MSSLTQCSPTRIGSSPMSDLGTRVSRGLITLMVVAAGGAAAAQQPGEAARERENEIGLLRLVGHDAGQTELADRLLDLAAASKPAWP